MGFLSAPPPSTAEYAHGPIGLCLGSSRNRFDFDRIRYSSGQITKTLLPVMVKPNGQNLGIDSAIEPHKRLAVP